MRRLFLVCLVLMTLPALAAAPTNADRLQEILLDAMVPTDFAPPSTAEYASAVALFGELLAGNPDHEGWAVLGFEIVVLDELMILRELADQRRGAGIYAVRRERAGSSLVLQAPHAVASDDRHTAELAMLLATDTDVLAGAWSTIDRRAADLADLGQSFFQAFTEAVAVAVPEAVLLQLHGYRAESRRSLAARSADMILSAGQRARDPRIEEASDCLAALDMRALAYPRDVNELGGTSNRQGKLLQQHGHAGFTHVEMSDQGRVQLLGSDELRRGLLECLGTGRQS